MAKKVSCCQLSLGNTRLEVKLFPLLLGLLLVFSALVCAVKLPVQGVGAHSPGLFGKDQNILRIYWKNCPRLLY